MRTAEQLAEMVVNTTIESNIEDAQDAGDDAEAQRLYQISQGVEDIHGEPASGVADTDAATDDAPQIQALDVADPASWAEYQSWDELTEHEQEDEYTRIYDASDPEMSNRILHAAWPGGEYDNNVGFAMALFAAVPGSTKALRVLEAAGFGDNPDLIKWLASAGRLMARAPGDPSTIATQGPQKMESTMTGNVEAQIDTLQEQIETAQAAHDADKANRLFAQQQGLYRLLPGGGDPLVGSSGGPTA